MKKDETSEQSPLVSPNRNHTENEKDSSEVKKFKISFDSPDKLKVEGLNLDLLVDNNKLKLLEMAKRFN